MKELKWKLRTFNDIDYDNIDISLLLRDMLKFRGIENPEEWLQVTKEDENNPSLLKNIDKAAELIHSSISSSDTIYLQVDCDTDGYTSSAILYKFLSDISDCNIKIGIHEGKEHGLDLQMALEASPNLVIVPDASGNPDDYVKLNKKNIKSIILDHHDYKEEDFNTVVVNCNFEPYPNKSLSGAGVVLKLCQYYCKQYGLDDYNLDSIYALASIGMVADVMSLQELENQFIIRYGLKHIQEHEFFNELLKDRMGNPVELVTIKDIGWSIGPNINAVIRLGDIEEKQLLFDTLVFPNKNINSKKRGSNDDVVPCYKEMCRICKNLKAKQTRMVQKAIQIIEPQLDLRHNLICYIDEDNQLPFELSGLIANRLLTSYKRPVMLLRHFHDYENINMPDCWAGSVRAQSAENFEDPRSIINEFTGVRETGGHANAFGLKVFKDSIDKFTIEAKDKLDKIDFNNQLYTVEASVPCRPFNTGLGKLFAAEDIWGSGIERPLIRITNIDCIGAEYMGRESQHVKIITPNIDIVIFDDINLVNTLKKSKKYMMNAIGEVSWNDWEDQPKLQLIVNGYELIEKEDDGWNIYDF
jgi:single-stranded-DNA-specific exonuclease